MENNNDDTSKEEIKILSQESIDRIKTKTQEAKSAGELRKNYTDQAFVLLWQLLFLIGIPAALALYFGKKLDSDGGKTYTSIFIILALILSWTMIIVKYKKYLKEVKRVEDKIKENKK